MEFIFELFAEILGRSDERTTVAPVEKVEAEEAEAEVLLEEQEQVEVQPVNIFNVVNFH